MILDNLDAAVKRLVQKLNRRLGQKVSHAQAEQSEQYQDALAFIDVLHDAYLEGYVPVWNVRRG